MQIVQILENQSVNVLRGVLACEVMNDRRQPREGSHIRSNGFSRSAQFTRGSVREERHLQSFHIA